MQADLYQQWKKLLAALDTARSHFDATHHEVIERVEREAPKNARSLLDHFTAHDLAAERWVAARSALMQFCRAHPDICA